MFSSHSSLVSPRIIHLIPFLFRPFGLRLVSQNFSENFYRLDRVSNQFWRGQRPRKFNRNSNCKFAPFTKKINFQPLPYPPSPPPPHETGNCIFGLYGAIQKLLLLLFITIPV